MWINLIYSLHLLILPLLGGILWAGCDRPLYSVHAASFASCSNGFYDHSEDSSHIRLLGRCLTGKEPHLHPDGKIRIFDFSTGVELFQFDDPNASESGTPDPEYQSFLLTEDTIVVSDMHSRIEFRDAATGTLRNDIKFLFWQMTRPILSTSKEFIFFLGFPHENSRQDSIGKVLNLKGQEVFSFPSTSIFAQSLPDPDRIVTIDGDDNHTFHIISLSQKMQLFQSQALFPLLPGPTEKGDFRQWQFLPGSRFLSYQCHRRNLHAGVCAAQVGSYGAEGQKLLFQKQWNDIGVAYLNEPYNGNPLLSFSRGQVFNVSYRGDRLVSTSSDGKIITLLDSFTGQELQQIDTSDERAINPVFTPDDQYLLFSRSDFRWEIINLGAESHRFVFNSKLCHDVSGWSYYSLGSLEDFSTDGLRLFILGTAECFTLGPPVISMWDLSGL